MTIWDTLGRKLDEAIDSATTPSEKQEDAYKQLVARLPDQRTAVARVIAGCTIERAELTRRQAIVTEAQNKLAEAKQGGASDATIKHLADVLEATNSSVAEQQQLLTEHQTQADEARASLGQTIAALEQLGKRVTVDKTKSDLAEAIRIAADAKQTANEITSAISEAGKHSQQVHRELEEARVANQLVGELKTGPVASPAVQAELDAINAKSAAASGRAELEKLSGQTGTTPAPAADKATIDKATADKGREELSKILGDEPAQTAATPAAPGVAPAKPSPTPLKPTPAAPVAPAPKSDADRGRDALKSILGDDPPEKS